jgi:DNA-binding NarL/FixJ family response regulator
VAFDKAQDILKRWRSLSPREQQVAALICLGHDNRSIGKCLVIADETVKTHVHRILVKFIVHSKGELRVLLRDWDFSEFDG